MWQADTFAKTFDTTDVSRAMHRYAGRQWNLSCMPQRSSLTRGYTAEINLYEGDGQMRANIALGNGPDPVAAALDGYRKIQPADFMWLVFDLELQAELLRRAVVQQRAFERDLERVIDLLTDVLRMVNTAS
jgi:hypothetical protein